MNRRTFLRTSAASAATLALASRASRSRLAAQTSDTTSASPASPASPNSDTAAPALSDGFELLRRNVGIFHGRGGTIGWLSSPDALCVIDTQFPDTAAQCLAGLPGRGSARLIDVLLNTHHHIDHTSGNPVFKPAVKCIVAHANVPALQRAASARMNPPTVDQQVYANMTFADSWNMTFPDETLHARHYGPAHTNGDIIIHFEKANVVHIGDLVFNRLYPVIDRIGGGNISSWIKILETARATYPADARYIFGHGNPNPKFGPTGTRDDLLVMRDYLTGLLDYTRKQIAAGKSKAEIMKVETLPGFPDYEMANRLASNLDVAYDELTESPVFAEDDESVSLEPFEIKVPTGRLLTMLSNRDVGWDLGYVGREPILSPNAEAVLKALNVDDINKIKTWLSDSERFAIAHVLLTKTAKDIEYTISASEWNKLRVIGGSLDNGDVYDLEQMRTLQDMWAKIGTSVFRHLPSAKSG